MPNMSIKLKYWLNDINIWTFLSICIVKKTEIKLRNRWHKEAHFQYHYYQYLVIYDGTTWKETQKLRYEVNHQIHGRVGVTSIWDFHIKKD